MRVGFVGLGSQGEPMARRILDAGHPLTLWARRAATLEPFAGTAAVRARTPAELGAASELVGICVLDDAGVEEVLMGETGVLAGMRPGGVVAVHSTVHPETCRRLAALAGASGVTLIDAPVSGGGAVAAQGKLLVMVGSDPATFERCLPVFSSYGDPVRRVGPLGSAQAAKLINNALMTANLCLAHDALALGESLGIDPAALGDVLRHGSGRSFALEVYAGAGSLAPLAARGGWLLRKDLDLLADVARGSDAAAASLVPAAERVLHLMLRDRAPR